MVLWCAGTPGVCWEGNKRVSVICGVGPIYGITKMVISFGFLYLLLDIFLWLCCGKKVVLYVAHRHHGDSDLNHWVETPPCGFRCGHLYFI